MPYKSLFLYQSLVNTVNMEEHELKSYWVFYTPLGLDLKLAWVGLSSPGYF